MSSEYDHYPHHPGEYHDDCEGCQSDRLDRQRPVLDPPVILAAVDDNDQVVDRTDVSHAIRELIRWLGDDPNRQGLIHTPRRVVDAMRELTAGYRVDPVSYLSTVFDEHADQLITVSGIRIVSLCEHHLLPFTGSAVVGYIPSNGKVVGLSKIPRLVDAFARRLQVQERLTEQVADALQSGLNPAGVGVVIRAHHSCMGLRGPMQPNAEMTTSALRGALLDKPEARAEFLALAQVGL